MKTHCREAAGAGPAVVKVVPVTGVSFSGVTMDQVFVLKYSTTTIRTR